MSSPELNLTVRRAEPAVALGDEEAPGALHLDGTVTWRGRAGGGCAPEARFSLAPLDFSARAEVSYVGETPVAQTTWTLGESRVVVTDFLPLRLGRGGDATAPRRPKRRLVRLVEALAGTVTLGFHLAASPGGRGAELVQDPEGLLMVGAGQSLVFQTGGEVVLRDDGAVEGLLTIPPGHRHAFLLTWHDTEDPDIAAAVATEPEWELDGTYEFWLAWARRCPFQGARRQAVVRLAALARAVGFGPEGTGLAGAAALAAWGFEAELAAALAAWDGGPLPGEGEAWLLDVLAEGYATGLVEPFAWLPRAEALSRAAGRLAERLAAGPGTDDPPELVAGVAGLWGAVRLAEDGLLPGEPAAWRSLLRERLAQATAGPGAWGAGWLEALGLDPDLAPKLPDVAPPPDLDGPAEPLARLWAIRRTLRAGAYTQARRALDGVLQLEPWESPPEAWARTLWLAALIHLQEPPAPGRMVLPDDVGFD